jgi:hypothetical protein
MATPPIVEQLPSSIDARLYRGDDLRFVVIVQKSGVILAPKTRSSLPRRNLTGNRYELLITGCGHRGTVEVLSAIDGELLLTVPSGITTYLGGKSFYSLVEIDEFYQRRTILGGCLDVLSNSGCTSSDESRSGFCGTPNVGGILYPGIHNGHQGVIVPLYPNLPQFPNPTISGPSLGVSSLNGLTGSLATSDSGLLATANRTGFVKPDDITIEVDGNGVLSVIGRSADGSYVLPVATERRLGGVKAGNHVTIAIDGTLSANMPPALTSSAIIEALGYKPLESVTLSLSDLVDVSVSKVTDGDVLLYDSSQSSFVNQHKSSISDGGNF